MPETPMRPSDPGRRACCEEHGVWYNVGTSAGCPLCLAAAAKAAPEPGLRVSPFRIVGILGVGAALYFGVNAAIDTLAATGDEVHARAFATLSKLNPDRFRPELEAVEAAVYPEATALDQAARVFDAANALSEAIRHISAGNAISNNRIAQHSQAVLAFGTAMSSQEDVGYSAYDPQRGQAEWEALRASVFTSAEWFRSGKVPADQPEMEPATARTLYNLWAELDQLVRFTRSSAMRLEDPTHPSGSREERRLNSEWHDIRTAVAGRLRSIMALVPDNPQLMTTDAQRVHESLVSSADGLAGLVPLTQIPTRADREQLLDRAALHLSYAKEGLPRTTPTG